MKTTTLFDDAGLRTFALVLDAGEDPYDEITRFASLNGITAASLTAIGACRNATIGFFDPDINDYRSSRFDEQMEVLSLVGDIATKGDEPELHAHVVLGRRDSSTIGGHLQHAEIFPTMEIVLTETPAHLRKRIDPRTGLALISIGDSDTGA